MEAGVSAPSPITAASDEEQAPMLGVLLFDEAGL